MKINPKLMKTTQVFHVWLELPSLLHYIFHLILILYLNVPDPSSDLAKETDPVLDPLLSHGFTYIYHKATHYKKVVFRGDNIFDINFQALPKILNKKTQNTLKMYNVINTRIRRVIEDFFFLRNPILHYK